MGCASAQLAPPASTASLAMIAVEMWDRRVARSPFGGDWSRISTVSGSTTRIPDSSFSPCLFTASKPTTSDRRRKELGERESGEASRLSEYLTSLASALRPLWNMMLSRSLNVHVRPSLDTVHFSAVYGTIWSLSSRIVSVE